MAKQTFSVGDRARYQPTAPALWPQLKGVTGTIEMVSPYGDYCQLKFGDGPFDYILPNAQQLVRL